MNLSKITQAAIRTFVATIILLAIPSALVAATISAPVDKIKSAYIYQFLQFVTWPDISNHPDQSFNICVFGKETITENLKLLDLSHQGEKLIEVKFPKSMDDANNCNILYIAETNNDKLQAILEYLHDKPILSVSSMKNFAKRGGIIGFVTLNNKVRLQINRKPALQANLKISAKLLEVSTLVSNGTAEDKQ